MKGLIVLSLGILAALAIWSCKKHTSAPNTAFCTTCSQNVVSHKADTSDSAFYFLPTAFTPNFDGKNDVFGLLYDHLIVDSSTLTVWDIHGTILFSKTVDHKWNGTDMTGAHMGAGEYPVHLRLKTTRGATFDVCTCVTILQYTGNCIKTNGNTYYFPDQIDPANGFVYPTMETLCP